MGATRGLISFGYNRSKDEVLVVLIKLCNLLYLAKNKIIIISLRNYVRDYFDMGDTEYYFYKFNLDYIGQFLCDSLYWLKTKKATNVLVVVRKLGLI